MSLVLARKYRPSTFDDLVGQEATSATLSQALATDRLAHAYLFSGLRGSGKTSTARIFAKGLLCEGFPSSNPCNQCQSCLMANENRHMDIVEMDAASNRGIEDIKELIEHTKYKPSSRFKIFIIDEVHMLTNQAFNALLKTLEEPPEFVKFILATTDPLKLPATILSRTQHYRFKKIPQPLIAQHLGTILHKESVDFEEPALEMIARSAEGSLRDAITLLDQAIAFNQEGVTQAKVSQMLGMLEPTVIEGLLELIATQDTQGVLEFVAKYEGYETQMILDEMTQALKTHLHNGSKRFGVLIIDRLFRAIAQAKELLFIGSDGEFVLLVTLFKMIEAMKISTIDSLLESLDAPSQISKPKASTKEPSSPSDEKKVMPSTENQSNEPIEQTAALEPKDEPKKAAPAITQSPKELFEQLQKKLYDRNYELGEAFESSVEFVAFEENQLSISSSAEGERKKQLRLGYSYILMFAKEIFGLQTTIKNISSKTQTEPSANSEAQEIKEAIEPSSEPTKLSDPKTPQEDKDNQTIETAPLAQPNPLPQACEDEAAQTPSNTEQPNHTPEPQEKNELCAESDEQKADPNPTRPSYDEIKRAHPLVQEAEDLFSPQGDIEIIYHN